MLIDTHAHLHFKQYKDDLDHVLANATKEGVTKHITVGVNTADSRAAIGLAQEYENIWSAVGIHPHDADEAEQGISYIADLAGERKVVAIGECGLDYYRSQTSKEEQETAMRLQIELALEKDLPLIFHVREAFDDFWPIIDSYPNVRGVIHSFSDNRHNAEKAVERGFYVALNGIMTFTKDENQLEAAKAIPLDKLMLETDCPFLAPAPNRGKRNEPANIEPIAKFLARLRMETFEELATQTTKNAEDLFQI